MLYFVNPKQPKINYPSIMDIITGNVPTVISTASPGSTVTYKRVSSEKAPCKNDFDKTAFLTAISAFNLSTEKLRKIPRQELYNTFYIPKKTGGLRTNNAPNEDLSNALKMLRTIFSQYVGDYFHHAAAHAYVKNRSNRTAVEVHQKAKSKWFVKFDFSDFFGSTTLDFVIEMCARIYPMNIVVSTRKGRDELRKALELCFLNGGLPQGTQMSPFLTNLMMIPIDHEILAYAAKQSPHLVYTRYADDITISCASQFDYVTVERAINGILSNFNAPFKIKPEKTHYGSSSGRNWILGLMLNKENEITVGHDKKKHFKAMLCNYINDYKSGNFWEYDDVRKLLGLYSYYHSIEGEYIDYIIEKYNSKFGADVMTFIKSQLRGEIK